MNQMFNQSSSTYNKLGKRSQTLKALMENFKLNVSQSFSESENRTDANRLSLSVFRDACGVFKFKAGLFLRAAL